MKTALVIAGGVVLLLLFFAAIQLAVMRWARRRAELIEREHLADREVLRRDPFANGLGRRSRGLRQVRGNGLLLLTPDSLLFHPLVGGEPYEIPLAAITSIDAPRVHLAKTRFRPLLAVSYRSPEEGGEIDCAAWDLGDREGWVEAIERARAAI